MSDENQPIVLGVEGEISQADRLERLRGDYVWALKHGLLEQAGLGLPMLVIHDSQNQGRSLEIIIADEKHKLQLEQMREENTRPLSDEELIAESQRRGALQFERETIIRHLDATAFMYASGIQRYMEDYANREEAHRSPIASTFRRLKPQTKGEENVGPKQERAEFSWNIRYNDLLQRNQLTPRRWEQAIESSTFQNSNSELRLNFNDKGRITSITYVYQYEKLRTLSRELFKRIPTVARFIDATKKAAFENFHKGKWLGICLEMPEGGIHLPQNIRFLSTDDYDSIDSEKSFTFVGLGLDQDTNMYSSLRTVVREHATVQDYAQMIYELLNLVPEELL